MNDNPTINLAWVKAQKANLLKQLQDLEATERVLRGVPADSQPQLPLQPQPVVAVSVPASTYGSKKQALLEIVAMAPTGATTPSVISEGRKLGYDWKTENVSPQLSTFRKNELLELKDGQWFIAPKGREYLASLKE